MLCSEDKARFPGALGQMANVIIAGDKLAQLNNFDTVNSDNHPKDGGNMLRLDSSVFWNRDETNLIGLLDNHVYSVDIDANGNDKSPGGTMPLHAKDTYLYWKTQ